MISTAKEELDQHRQGRGAQSANMLQTFCSCPPVSQLGGRLGCIVYRQGGWGVFYTTTAPGDPPRVALRLLLSMPPMLPMPLTKPDPAHIQLEREETPVALRNYLCVCAAPLYFDLLNVAGSVPESTGLLDKVCFEF